MTDRLPPAMERVIRELSRLPTIGRKSAQRLAFHLLRQPADQARALGGALESLHREVRFCSRCRYLAEGDLCPVCADPARDAGVVCVVEDFQDVAALEKARSYAGVYHVLMGRLSPLQGVTPEDLTIEALMVRLRAGEPPVREVVLATNPNVDGDATAMYLSGLIAPLGVRVTRLGLGLAVGSSLEYSDELTLRNAFEGRRED